ncbi:MAG: FkbM family methyltransferase [Bacteroidetes bacterium]|nr:FkbM family methyltransferase [Bacteroidota bacterium]
MLKTIADGISYTTRTFSFIPGMYFVTKPLHDFFTKYYSTNPEKAWRTISLNGYRLKVNASYRMGALVYWRGAHEWAPMFLLNEILKPGMTLYDVGANMGEFTMYAAHLIGSKGRVVSFEPMKETYQLLEENISLNQYQDRISPFNIALSDKKGEADLFAASEVNAVGSHEDGLHTLFGTQERSSFLHKIQLEKMDELLESNHLPTPDVIKIDVEGSELFALKGATKILEQFHPKIIMEFSKENCEAAGYTQNDLLDFLSKFGYQFLTIENRGKLKPLDLNNLPVLTNLYCK